MEALRSPIKARWAARKGKKDIRAVGEAQIDFMVDREDTTVTRSTSEKNDLNSREIINQKVYNISFLIRQ